MKTSMSMKRLRLGGSVLIILSDVSLSGIVLSGIASAADLAPKPFYRGPAYVPPAYDWSGFYLGVVGGGGWADSSHSDGVSVATGNFNQSGGTLGGTVGYNWQAGSLVYGFEGDGSWADIQGSTTSGCASQCYTSLRWVDTARGRFGYAWDNWMPYVTAGLAAVDVHAGQSGLTNGIDWRLGPTVGVGVEWMFLRGWSAKAEYLYATFGSDTTYTATNPVDVAERNVSLLRLGVDYHFGY